MMVFEIIDICKPKDLVYIAIDGVCPRAKIEQQRKRRFKSALEKNMGYKCYHTWNKIYE